MNDEELDDLILSRLRQRSRALSAADLAAFFNEPESRVEDRLRSLAANRQVKESSTLPDPLDAGRHRLRLP